jgi:hypothetical protein
MRILRFALCGVFLTVAGLRAAEDEEKPAPPEEIPDFNQLDEYTYVPKSTLSLGARFFIRGPKTTYSGQGALPSPVDPGDNPFVANVSRTYADGVVDPDARQVPSTNGVGQSSSTGIAPDGRTNSWSYEFPAQLDLDGNIDFHNYSGEVTDTGSHGVNGVPTEGLELVMDKDMGKIGKHMKWSFTVGFSISDIHAGAFASVPTELTTLTDTYDLFGQVPPAPPYTSPSTISQMVTSGAGNTQSQTVDQSILLGNEPISRTTTVTPVVSENRYFTEGSYYTLRAGPTLIVPLTKHLNLNLSAGPALIYAGSEMNVLEDLALATGESDLTNLYQKENNKVIPGIYADVNLQYDVTDTAGIYFGGVYQSAGSFTQSVQSGPGTEYSSKVDFANQEGVKGGMTVRF